MRMAGAGERAVGGKVKIKIEAEERLVLTRFI